MPPSPEVHESRFVAAATRLGDLPPPTLLEIAFVGRSNVGKSSLMNALLGRRNLVRTSSTPGCTRGLNLFEAKLRDGAILRLVDLPGYGYAKRSKTERDSWASLVESYLLERPSLAAVVVIVDVRRGVEQDDADAIELARSAPRVSRQPVGVVVVATKTDKLAASARKPALKKVRASGHRVVGFSSKDPTTTAGLWQAIRRTTGLGSPDPQGTVPMASPASSSRPQSP